MSTFPCLDRRFPVLVFLLSLFLPAFSGGAMAQDGPCDLSQTVFDFGEHDIGWSLVTGYMSVQNTGAEPLEINPTVDSPHFSISGLHIWLEPGEQVTLNPRFHPESMGYLEAVVDMGNGLCSDILLTGVGLGRSCAVNPPFLAFGDVELGHSATRTVTLTNDGDLEFPVEPGSISPVVAVIGESRDLAPGESMDIEVVFTPRGPGAFTGVVDWGAWYPTCAGLRFSGEGSVNMAPGQNRVGVFFDEDYTELLHLTDGTAGFVTGYLVLTDPAPAVGVAGWELLPAATGPGSITGWDIRGEFINAGLGDNLIIGLAEPLPFAEDILLATCQIFVNEAVDQTVAVELKPVWNPSITGRMAWQPAGGDEPEVMLPFTGLDAVAWIKSASLTPVDDPLPTPEALTLTNVPNPFNPSTEIRFTVAGDGPARVRIFDLTGRLVRTLVDESLTAGPYARLWDGRDEGGRQAASGAYYVRLETRSRTVSHKIMLLK